MPLLLYICIFFSDFMCFDMSLLLLTVTLRGVSNKHCLLPLFSLRLCRYLSIEGQGHFFTIYFPGFVCFVLY